MSEQRKYIPPHLRARGRGTFSGRPRSERGGKSSYHNSRDSNWKTHRQPQEHFPYQEGEEFVATLKSKKNYESTDLPSSAFVSKAVEISGILNYKFKAGFQEDKLRDLLRWFRNIGRSDTQAVLEFPPALDKEHRKVLHLIAENFGLGTSSQGFGDDRFISIYTVEAASFDVGKINMTEEEKRKADDVWLLVRKFGNPECTKHSHNEIKEMVIADQLDPILQDLLDTNQEFLASEFERRCNIDEGDWRSQCIPPDDDTEKQP